MLYNPPIGGASNDPYIDANPSLGIEGSAVPAAAIEFAQREIVNVITAAGLTPSNGDLTQLRQAIAQMINAGGAIKIPVRVATTGPINLAAPGATIDGVAMNVGERFLDKDNATASARGFYIWNGAAVPATRSTDADGVGELVSGMLAVVQEGTANADTIWELSTDGVITIGTTGITFVRKDQQSSTGKHTIWIPAGAITPRITNGAALGVIETTTNKIMVRTLDYDPATAEYGQFSIRMPKSWDEGTVTAYLVWSNASGTGNVVWGVQAVAISDDDVLDAAFGAAQTVTDGVTAAGDLMQTAETPAITIAGTPATADMVIFQVYRDAANGSDTLAVDARLHGVAIIYTTDAGNDA